MSQLIPDNNVLLQFVPNVLKSVQGETLLFDKIAPHLEVAEAWLTTTFLSEAVLAELPTRDAAPDGIFEEWKQSETAALFKDHGYKNKKKSSGYWF